MEGAALAYNEWHMLHMFRDVIRVHIYIFNCNVLRWLIENV